MSSITVHNWKEVSNDGGNFVFVDPEYHPTYWEIPKWWYRGKSTVYTSCVRVDFQGTLNSYLIFIDGTTPLMTLTMEWDGSKLNFSDTVDVDRILICQDLGAVNRGETTEYVDIQNDLHEGWVVRFNGLPDPIVDIPPEWIQEPIWMFVTEQDVNADVEIGDQVVARTGSYTGGMPSAEGTPPRFRYRWQVKKQDGSIISDSWVNDPEELTNIYLDTPAPWWPEDAIEVRFQNQVRDYNPVDNSTRTLTKFLNWRPLVEVEPLAIGPGGGADWAAGNNYEVDQTIEALTANWTGGKEPVTYRARMLSAEGDDPGYTSQSWTSVTAVRESYFYKIPYDGRFRLECEAIDANGVSVKSFSDEQVVADPTTYWGDITVTLDGENYDFYEAAPYEIYEDDTVAIRVTWNGTATGNCLWSKRAQDSAEFNDATSPTPNVTFPENGTNILTFTLTDPSGLADPTSIAYPIQIVALEKPSLLPVVTKVNGEVYDQQSTGGFSAPGGSEITLTVETNPAAADITKSYSWTERQGEGQFISSDKARSVAFVLGDAGTYSVCVCAITAENSIEGQTNSAFVQIFAT